MLELYHKIKKFNISRQRSKAWGRGIGLGTQKNAEQSDKNVWKEVCRRFDIPIGLYQPRIENGRLVGLISGSRRLYRDGKAINLQAKVQRINEVLDVENPPILIEHFLPTDPIFGLRVGGYVALLEKERIEKVNADPNAYFTTRVGVGMGKEQRQMIDSLLVLENKRERRMMLMESFIPDIEKIEQVQFDDEFLNDLCSLSNIVARMSAYIEFYRDPFYIINYDPNDSSKVPPQDIRDRVLEPFIGICDYIAFMSDGREFKSREYIDSMTQKQKDFLRDLLRYANILSTLISSNDEENDPELQQDILNDHTEDIAPFIELVMNNTIPMEEVMEIVELRAMWFGSHVMLSDIVYANFAPVFDQVDEALSL